MECYKVSSCLYGNAGSDILVGVLEVFMSTGFFFYFCPFLMQHNSPKYVECENHGDFCDLYYSGGPNSVGGLNRMGDGVRNFQNLIV